MPSTLPDGDPQPSDGALPPDVRAGVGSRAFSVYIHVPYCATRCGYCDFNTYTASELGGGASQASYAGDAIAELKLARGVLGDVDLPVQTVFFGGGTPTLLPVADLAAMLTAVRDFFGLVRDAEVTTEANPESVDAESLAALRDAGFTRISLGMQSARQHVLAVLDRVHTPGTPARRAAEARAVGFEHVSLDLIYGTPGESDDDWRASLDAAIAAEPDHISAYSLIVEDGTRLAGRVARGELPRPDDDVLADRYLIAEEMLKAAGFDWYEVSNWAKPGGECRHNLGYWRSFDWWGVGPGAHSHVGGVRWWNVKHPTAYAARVSAGDSPGYAREVLDASTRRVERVLLQLRLAEGLDLLELDDAGRAAALAEVAAGLLEPLAFEQGRAVLTREGRLLADGVVRRLLH
ncbi:MAG TPA: radical SAM family heme chaperone HemW [Acidothermaceae bacterium]|nr:radical SAM family heme chaperone HemW [Acidothermaceae bacterium]